MSLHYQKLLFEAPALNGKVETSKDDYVFESQLGSGAFGEVWKIRHKSSNKIYACKIVMKETVLRMIDQFRRELLIMYKLSHPHIIKLFHHFEDEENFYILLDFFKYKYFQIQQFKLKISAFSQRWANTIDSTRMGVGQLQYTKSNADKHLFNKRHSYYLTEKKGFRRRIV